MATQDTKWEYTIYVSHSITFGLNPFPNAMALWEKKDKEGFTDLDSIRDYGEQGWELVSTSPIAAAGTTTTVMFTFKRPKIE
jgi:hypothetical protein